MLLKELRERNFQVPVNMLLVYPEVRYNKHFLYCFKLLRGKLRKLSKFFLDDVDVVFDNVNANPTVIFKDVAIIEFQMRWSSSLKKYDKEYKAILFKDLYEKYVYAFMSFEETMSYLEKNYNVGEHILESI